MRERQANKKPAYVVQSDEEHEVIEFLDKYMNLGRHYDSVDSDRFWYFRPWRGMSTQPKTSGVYATMHLTHHGGYFGFSYYAADCGYWLMSYDNVEAAQRTADSFRAAVKAGDSHAMGIYSSNHQYKLWSEARLGGLVEMPSWSLMEDGSLVVNDEALGLALLRQAVDPKLKRRTCGR